MDGTEGLREPAGGPTPGSGRRRRRRNLVLAGVVALAVIAAWGLITRGGGDIGVVDDAAAERAGVELLGAQLTSVVEGIDPSTGLPTTERDRYDVGEGARLWLAFRYAGDDPGRESLEVVWSRDGDELFRSSWRLPQPVENHNVALGANSMDIAGSYQVQVLVADEVLYTETFQVS